MLTDHLARLQRTLVGATLAFSLALGGCAGDGDDWGGSGGGVSTSVSVGYGGYYGPGWYGGYYEPYPPVVVVPPGERPERPSQGPDRPTTLPADVGASKPAPRAQTAPSRPASVDRPTSRPSPRPAPRPMPRAAPRMGRR
jgi:hypothetical protein